MAETLKKKIASIAWLQKEIMKMLRKYQMQYRSDHIHQPLKELVDAAIAH